MLNPDQLKAVRYRKGQVCVVSGPGSGKTTVVVARFKEMIEEGISPRVIRCATFTKEAAETMVRRAGSAGKGVFTTLHSLGYEIVRAEKGNQPVDPEKRHRLLFKLTKMLALDYKYLDSFITKMRHDGITPEEAMEHEEWDWGYRRAYKEYEKVRAAEGWIDFASMLADSVQLLEIARIRAKWQFEYVMMDEAQDTDDLQWRMIQLLSEKHGNVMVVGDPNQAIYAWRGANPENLTSFQKWFPKGEYIYLGQNYRSTKTIVDFVRGFAPVDTPLNQKMLPARTDSGVPIQYKAYISEDAQAEAAIALASADPLNSVILARTNRLLAPLENFCYENKIKFTLLGRSGFWRQNEIRKAVANLSKYVDMRLSDAIRLAVPQIESRYAVDDRTDRDNEALRNLETLKKISERFKTTRELVDFANKVANMPRQTKGITLSTVHQAKGGEWKNVFVIGADLGVMPHKKGEPDEEKRIWFVAISRAIDLLRISWVGGNPSPFIKRHLSQQDIDTLLANSKVVEKYQAQISMF